MDLESYAIAVLIDNSRSSINGDFRPNRLDAQKTTTERLALYFFDNHQGSELSVSTMSNEEFGIRISFTTSHQKILKALEGIKSVGNINVEKGLKSALLSLNYCSENIEDKRVLVFISSNHNITKEVCDQLIKLFKEEDISLDMVVFGKDVPNVPLLKKLCAGIPRSHFVEVRECDTVLSDKVLQSEIRPGEKISNINPMKFAKQNPDFLFAIKLSQEKPQPAQNEKQKMNSSMKSSKKEMKQKRK